MNWFNVVLHFFGVRPNANSGAYAWWSGAGSDLGELALIGALIQAYHHLNCGAPGCWRVGKHPTADRMHRLCHRHHPDLMGHKRTLEEIHNAHNEAKAAQ